MLYGISAEKPDDRLLSVFRQTKPFEIQLAPVTLFANSEFDVVKLDVVSPYLMALNRSVSAVAEAPGNSFPVYKPHATIAYVKKGTCDRLEGKSPFDSVEKLGVTSIGKEGKFTAKEVIFSSSNGTKIEFELGHPKLDAKLAAKAVIGELLSNSGS